MRTVDFTEPKWGHNIFGVTYKKLDDESASVMVIVTPSPKVGDVVRFGHRDGFVAQATVRKVTPCKDPGDMYTVELVDWKREEVVA